jgi:lipopolysaccharide/colanic/teichoic acid biosynthesis glycosyltransferase
MAEMHIGETDTATMNGRAFSLNDGMTEVASSSVLAGGPSRAQAHTQSQSGPRHLFRYRVVKRCVDIALILLASPVLLLIVGAIAIAIRIGSPGPIFFSHRRIRCHGAFFTMWKFRTMCINSSEILDDHLAANPAARAEWRQTHKLKHDPRVTRVGNFLRRTSLDELPQLWNVFTGSMSLVGPRPIVAAEVEKYGPHFNDYCLVKPGITGLWQVSGRSSCTYPERVALDCRYAHNWSLTADAKILVRTLPSVLHQHGAY